jgi:hypothetical protein
MPENLELLRADNQKRLRELAAKGIMVKGLSDMYTNTMLELLLGDRLEEAQLMHERKVSVQLDEIERQQLRAQLLAPRAATNGGG